MENIQKKESAFARGLKNFFSNKKKEVKQESSSEVEGQRNQITNNSSARGVREIGSGKIPVNGRTLATVMQKKKLREESEESKKKTKKFKYPFKWMKNFRQAGKKNNRDKILVFFFNKKNEIEAPKFMPIFDGNMVIWKNKPYEFDPRAVWTVLGVKGNPRCYALKEVDRRPIMNKVTGKYTYGDCAISNLDLGDIRARGDSTESDEFLIKAALKARVDSDNKKKMSIIVIVVIIAVVAALAYFLFKGGGGAGG